VSIAEIKPLLEDLQEISRLSRGKNDVVLNPPATQNQVSAMEQALGFSVHEELAAMYLVANGSAGAKNRILITHPFSTSEQCVEDYQNLRQMGEEEEKGGYFSETLNSPAYYNAYRKDTVKTEIYAKGWVPIGNDRTSDYIVVDHSPAQNGRAGQVIYVGMMEELVLISDSISGYLRFLIKHHKTLLKYEDTRSEIIRCALGRSRLVHFFKRL